ncbi:MAG: response regulator transcription factor [Peptoniphilus sp.]|nr:response regulator transcription factor [Peptoniphilus sp.]MDY3118814.1 response regulator transcription factor [Peptoniphilus sp.]
MKKILLIEDDKNLNKGLAIALAGEGEILSAATLAEGRMFLEQADFILLDLNLPDGDGLVFLEETRRKSHVPILVLSAIDMETHIISAIKLGADDYLTKPFSLGILQAKIHRLLEKDARSYRAVFEKGPFVFDFSKHLFRKDGGDFILTPIEARILYFLVASDGGILTKETLMNKVWGTEGDFVDGNTLAVNMSRLRGKLRPYAPIETVFGVGYRWSF